MSGDDDLPDYLRGVTDQPEPSRKRGGAADVRTIGAAVTAEPEDDDDDDYVEDRPPFISPLLVIAVLALLILISITSLGSVMIGGSMVGGAEEVTLRRAAEISDVVVAEAKVIDNIGSLGGDRAKLQRLYDAIDGQEGVARGLASLQFSHAVETEVVQLGDIRGTPLHDRQEKLVLATRNFEQALEGWRSASGGVLGSVAITIGMANPAP